jgi:CubicO group peptidase (beta-lactamase class C family)
MRNELGERIARAIEEKVFPGCVVGLVRENGDRFILPLGRLTYDTDAPDVRDDSIYDVASLTKSIPTASLALSLIEARKLRLDVPVSAYVPELRNDRGAIIEDLLRYRVGGVRLSTLKDKTADALLASALESGLEWRGEPRYTNLPALLLGLVVERVDGASLHDLAHEHFFGPLYMRSTSFFPDVELTKSHIAPTEVDEWRGEVRGVPHDESAYVLAQGGRASGHAGLFSNAPDLLNFFEALLSHDHPAIVAGGTEGLGWQTHGSPFMGKGSGRRTFGKTGFTGTSCLIDPDKGVALVILSNRTYPTRPQNNDAINAFRTDIADIVFGR